MVREGQAGPPACCGQPGEILVVQADLVVGLD